MASLLKLAYVHLDGEYALEEILQSEEALFRSLRTLDERPTIDFVELTGGLSCRSLEETAAFLRQREFYSNASLLNVLEGAEATWEDDLRVLHDTRWQGHLNDPTRLYSGCIEYFCTVNPDLDINDHDVLLTLLIVIDIALNPPLPPFANFGPRFDESGKDQFSDSDWIQIHPVLRFRQLTHAIKDIRPPDGTNSWLFDASVCSDFITRLCRQSGLMNLADYLTNNEVANPRGPVWRCLEDSPLSHLKRMVLTHHARARRIRKRWPLCVGAAAHHILYLPDLKDFLSRKKLESVFLAPLQMIAGTGYFSGIEESEYWKVLCASSHGRALASFLNSRSAFYEEGLPTDEMHHKMVSRTQDYLIARLLS